MFFFALPRDRERSLKKGLERGGKEGEHKKRVSYRRLAGEGEGVAEKKREGALQ